MLDSSWVCDLSRSTPRQREFHSKSLYFDKSNNGALLYSSATYGAVPYNVTNRKLTNVSLVWVLMHWFKVRIFTGDFIPWIEVNGY